MSSTKFTTTLLFLTRTFDELARNSRNLLEQCLPLTRSNLFIYIAPKLQQTTTITSKTRPQLRHLAGQFYSHSVQLDPHLNVVCLLHRIHSSNAAVKYALDYDLVLVDQSKPETEAAIRQHLAENFAHAAVEARPIRAIELGEAGWSTDGPTVSLEEKPDDQISSGRVYRHSILGGTFDRLHVGHKLLLTESLLLTSDRLLIGLADGALLAKKKLAELIEEAGVREAHVRALCASMRPDLELVVVPIDEPYGPSIVEPDYQCLIVSEETRAGGEAVNAKRRERGLPLLDLHVMALAREASVVEPGDEDKVSSSNERRRELGKLIRAPQIPPESGKPYVIGLTGGLASGKSAILADLAKLGAGCIDCDKLGHRVYVKGTRGYERLVETFGSGILAADGEIDRKELGKRVFVASSCEGEKSEQLKRLTDIVWPEVRRMVDERTRELYEMGHRVVVVEAPLLIEAGWSHRMNEIWVVFVPFDEALQRAMRRDGSDETKVRGTLNSQLSNKERIRHANVVFSSLWERAYTVKQVERAWHALLERLSQQPTSS